MAFFHEHGNLLRVCDLAALEGDDRFRQLRTRLFNGVFLALQDLAHEARAAGQIPTESSPGALASVLTTMLAHVSAHQPGFEAWGVSSRELTQDDGVCRRAVDALELIQPRAKGTETTTPGVVARIDRRPCCCVQMNGGPAAAETC